MGECVSRAMARSFWYWSILALSVRAAMAGLVIQNDGSDLCTSNMKDCTSRCAPPQSFIFMCDSGGTFDKPQSDCKCTPAPPAGAVTDGSAIFQLVQWPGPQACQGNTWLYDCAQYLNLQSLSGNMQGQAQDQASAMAAVAAAQAAVQAQTAAMATAQQQYAAMQQHQQQPTATVANAGTANSASASSTAVPGLGAVSVPGLPGDIPSSTTSATGTATTGGAGVKAGQTGADMGAPAGSTTANMMSAGSSMPSASVPAGVMNPGAASPASSLLMGRRHTLQFGDVAAGPAATSLPGAIPTTQLGPSCQKPIQGLVTGATAGVWVIPNFKGVASLSTKGNDTMVVQLGGQGSSCTAAYKLLSGQVLGLGQPTQSSNPTQTKSPTSAFSSARPLVWSMAAVLLTVILLIRL